MASFPTFISQKTSFHGITRTWRCSIVVLLCLWSCVVPFSKALTQQPLKNGGGRHVCLLEKFDNVQGPYFSALFDQLLEQTRIEQRHLAYCTTNEDLKKNADGERNVHVFLNDLQEQLDLDTSQLILLDEVNPWKLEEIFAIVRSSDVRNQSPEQSSLPNIIWVQGQNAFRSRHYLRTSGLDSMIAQQCGGDGPVSIYVGECAGALCAGPTMDIAHVKGDDPSASPELQVHGLNLLGDNQWVSFGIDKEKLETHDRTKENVENIHVCDKDQVFVWSQEAGINGDGLKPGTETATRFVMTPHSRGTIERYTTPDRLPPLVENSALVEGVVCTGEPSIDPSRAVQNPLGDSEWLEEFQEN